MNKGANKPGVGSGQVRPAPVSARPVPELARTVTNDRAGSRFVLMPLSLTLDQLLFLITAALLSMGLLMVQSADTRIRGVHENWLYQAFANKNAVHAIIAVAAMTLFWRLDYRYLLGGNGGKRYAMLLSPATWLVVLTVAFLAAVIVTPFGRELNGARRWLALGPLGFQPSELAKLSLVLFVAAYAVHCREEVRQFGAATVPILLLGAAVAIFAIKPEVLEKLHVHLGAASGNKWMFRSMQAGAATVLAAIAYLLYRYPAFRQWRWGFLPLMCGVGACIALVVKEDFGTTVLLAAVVVAMILMAGCRWWHVGLLLPPAGLVVYQMLHTPFRMQRLMAFRDPWADPEHAGYHPIQSLFAIGGGGWGGEGLNNSIQKMGYLPEANTDFIFAVICEELGFVGALLVVLLFAGFVFVGWRVMSRCSNLFGKMVAFGITAIIGLQAAINIAVVTVSMPTKGIALPLISSGGTGWIMNAVAIGILMSIERVNRREREALGIGRSSRGSRGFPVEVAVPAVPAVSAVPVVPAVPMANDDKVIS